MYYLYQHIRLDKNEIFYIGIGKKRKYFTNIFTEFSRAYTKNNRNKHWKNIINKTEYKVEILYQSDDREFIIQKECELIKKYGRKDLNQGTLVNLTDGGEGVYGFIMTEEHKKAVGKASKLRKGWKATEEAKHKMSLAKKGKKVLYRKKISLESRIKLSNSAKKKIGPLNNFYGKKQSLESKMKMSTPIEQYTLDGIKINEYYGLTDAANKTNSTISLISKVLVGKRKSHNNYIWKYKTI